MRNSVRLCIVSRQPCPMLPGADCALVCMDAAASLGSCARMRGRPQGRASCQAASSRA